MMRLFPVSVVCLFLAISSAQAQTPVPSMTTCQAEGQWTWCNDADGSDCETRTERGLGTHANSSQASQEALASCEATVARAVGGAEMSGGAGVPGEGCEVVNCSVLRPPPGATMHISTTASPATQNLPMDTPECAHFVGVICKMCGEAACSRFQERGLHPDTCGQLSAVLGPMGAGGHPAGMEAAAFGLCQQLTGP